TILEGQILKIDDNITNGANTAFTNNPFGNLKPAIEGSLNASREALNTYLSKLDLNVLQAPSIALSPDSWLDTTRATLTASYAQWDTQIAQLDTLLNNRVSTYSSNRTTSLLVAFAALLLVVYMWVGFYRAVMLSVTNLENAANLLASGTVSASAINLGGKDEMSQRAAAAMTKMASATTQMNSAMTERTNELTEVSYLLAYMHDGVIITDQQGVIKVLNGTATRMIDTEYDEAISKPLLTFLRDPRLQETMQAAISAPTQRFAVDVSINNRLVSVTVTFVSVENNITGLFVMQDVTELRTLQQQQQFVKASLVR
ncbi:MAG: PAS domain-containing protein, partial [Chloroflexia bacterium]